MNAGYPDCMGDSVRAGGGLINEEITASGVAVHAFSHKCIRQNISYCVLAGMPDWFYFSALISVCMCKNQVRRMWVVMPQSHNGIQGLTFLDFDYNEQSHLLIMIPIYMSRGNADAMLT